MDLASAVGARGDVDDSGVEFRGAGCDESWQQQICEQEVREMVDSELGFKAVYGATFWGIADS